MLARALVVWLGLLLVAITNGAIRVAWMIPRAGDYWGHVLSTATLCAGILLVTWLTIGWLRPATSNDAILSGVTWLALTVSFEFLGGHFLFGQPWSRLLADYDLFHGRIWVLVLVTTAVAPRLAFGTRRIPV
jgi:hypothetical protein